MISKSKIKQLSKLKLKKYRDSEHKFLVEGKRLVEEGLKSKFICLSVIVTSEFAKRESTFLTEISNLKTKLEIIKTNDFNKIASTKNPQGILAIFEKTKQKLDNIKSHKIIYLENISDPGNLGTILRTCNWFRIKEIMLSPNCAEVYNPKVLRASMGAIFHISIFENIEVSERLTELKKEKYQIFYADMKGEDYRKVKYPEKFIVVFCNEAFGPSEQIKEISNKSITIPKVGDIDSLNVSVAAGIIISKIFS